MGKIAVNEPLMMFLRYKDPTQASYEHDRKAQVCIQDAEYRIENYLG